MQSGSSENKKERRIKPVQEWKNVTKNNARQALTKSQKWKSLGNEKVPNF